MYNYLHRSQKNSEIICPKLKPKKIWSKVPKIESTRISGF